MKKIANSLLLVLALLIYCIPIGGIYQISKSESKVYEMNNKFVFEEKAYGSPCLVERMNVQEYYYVDGEVDSATNKYIDVSKYNVENIKYVVEVGEEIFKGQIIGNDGKQDVISDVNGVILEMGYADEPYVKIKSFDSLCLKFYIDQENVDIFDNKLYDKDGNEIEVISISNQMENGKIIGQLALEKGKYMCGQELNDFKLYTGYVFENALVISQDCVYEKKGTDAQYVRIVDEEGIFIQEVEVNTGYTDGEIICITGIEEGTYCDDGYKSVVVPKEVLVEES